jgi:hypothetical protein
MEQPPPPSAASTMFAVNNITTYRPPLFTMDNLNIHKHSVILNLIHGRNHRVIFRAPYWSCDGAIEYIFNTIQTKLQMDVYGIDTVFDMVNKIHTIVGQMPSFKRYFIHVGFPDN